MYEDPAVSGVEVVATQKLRVEQDTDVKAGTIVGV